jgi:hypothetical protein
VTIDRVVYDSGLYALEIGAIPSNSIYNASTANGLSAAFASYGPVSQNLSRAGLLAWAATSFGLNFSLQCVPPSRSSTLSTPEKCP